MHTSEGPSELYASKMTKETLVYAEYTVPLSLQKRKPYAGGVHYLRCKTFFKTSADILVG